jgi:hypothetical protein
MRRPLGQPVIVENVSGADGSIGVGRAARARPDGYTIGHVQYLLPYDVLNDFAPISPLVTGSYILFARKTMPAKDLNELIAWLKANPNKASVGVAAVGHRLVAALFQKERVMPSRPEEFHPEPLTDPDLILSHHPARATARRLPPSAESSGSSRYDPVGPSSTAMTCPLCSTGITPLHRYYGAVRPSPAHRYFRPRGWSRLCLFP